MQSAFDEAAHQDRRLLLTLSAVLTGLDAFAACVQAALGAPARTTAATLAMGAVACLTAHLLARRGRRRTAVGVLVGNQMLVPATITILAGGRDAFAILNLGIWFAAPLLIASAFVSYRWLLGLGAISATVFFAARHLVGATSAADAADPLIFVATVAALAAIARRHRDVVHAMQRAELMKQNAELSALKATLEERVSERTQALLAAEKMAAIGRLTAGIAHELTSPLCALLATAEHFQDLAAEYSASIGDDAVSEDDHRAIASEMADAAAVAGKAARRTANFVRSIKSQTRVAVVGKREPFDVVALVEDCVNLLAHSARSARCDVVVTPSAKSMVVWGAPHRLTQAITNLVQNAIDATGERGGGRIEVRIVRQPARGVAIEITDEGGGIADDVLARIFEPLFTTKPFGRGTGLGLAIVKEAVEQDLGGRVRVETAVGRGSSFFVELPESAMETPHAA